MTARDPVQQELSSLIEGVHNALRIAGRLLRAGRAIELAGLESEVGFLCAKVLDLPPEHGRALVDQLAGLLWEVECVLQELQAAPAPADQPLSAGPLHHA
jgi:hypothetical protein